MIFQNLTPLPKIGQNLNFYEVNKKNRVPFVFVHPLSFFGLKRGRGMWERVEGGELGKETRMWRVGDRGEMVGGLGREEGGSWGGRERERQRER